MPKIEYKSAAKPSLYAYPPPMEEKKREEREKVTTAVLSIAARQKRRETSEKKKEEKMDVDEDVLKEAGAVKDEPMPDAKDAKDEKKEDKKDEKKDDKKDDKDKKRAMITTPLSTSGLFFFLFIYFHKQFKVKTFYKSLNLHQLLSLNKVLNK